MRKCFRQSLDIAALLLLIGYTCISELRAEVVIFAVAEEDPSSIISINVERIWKADKRLTFEDYLEQQDNRAYKLHEHHCHEKIEARVKARDTDYVIVRPKKRACKNGSIGFTARRKRIRNFEAPRLPGVL